MADNGNTAIQNLVVDYRIASGAITSSNSGNSATWTAASGLSFASPIHTGSSALDGNSAANRQALSVTLTGLNIASNQEIFFRFFDANDSGNDHALAADNVAITANPVFKWDAAGTTGAVANGGSGTWNTTSAKFNADNTANYNYYTAWNNSALDGKVVFGGTTGTVTLGTGINANRLQFDSNGYSVQSNTLTFVGNAPTIAVTTAAHSATISSTIAGSNGLEKVGAGTAILSVANTYSGTTTVSAGTLAVTNTSGSATGTSLVSVGTGGTLLGTGIISGATTVAGILSPGSGGTGTITTGALTLSNSSTLQFEINTGTTDLITFGASSPLTLGGGILALTLGGGFDYTATYPLVTGVSGVTGSFSSVTGYDLAYNPVFSLTGSSYNLEFTPVPEPSSIAVAMGLLGLVGYRERRKGAALRRSSRLSVA